MANSLHNFSTSPFSLPVGVSQGNRKNWLSMWSPLALAFLLAPVLFAQASPRVTGVDPASGKVDDAITVAGTNLGKASVSGVFLSDDKEDHKATVVDQADEKIVIKVPQVKAGDYNLSIQVGERILILPIR